MQDAEDLVDGSLIEGDSRVGEAGELLEDAIHRFVEVDALDLVARHHDVGDGRLLEVEDVEQHPTVARWHEDGGLAKEGAQLLRA